VQNSISQRKKYQTEKINLHHQVIGEDTIILSASNAHGR